MMVNPITDTLTHLKDRPSEEIQAQTNTNNAHIKKMQMHDGQSYHGYTNTPQGSTIRGD